MAGLALLQEEAGQDGGDDNGDDQSGIAPVSGVPAQGEVGHLIDFDEEGTILSEIDGVQVDTGGNRLHEAEHGDCLGNTQGHHDGQDDNADSDNRAGTGHGGEDDSGNDVQQGDGDHGLIAAQLNSLTDQGGSNAGLHQDAAEPGAPADVDQRGAPAFGGGLVDLVQDGDQFNRLAIRIESSGGQELRGRESSAQEGQNSPQNSDDKEADHQVMALNAVISQAEEREEQQNTDYELQGKYPFLNYNDSPDCLEQSFAGNVLSSFHTV